MIGGDKTFVLEKIRIELIWRDTGAVISYLEDCDVEEGKELVFVDT